jgi:hypothetical protein
LSDPDFQMPRKPIEKTEATAVMVANNHTCCICYESRKHVQIHHIDGDPSHNDLSNLAVLCLDCHSRVSGDEGFGRRYTQSEVREYKVRWEKSCGENKRSEANDKYDEPIETTLDVRLIPVDEHFPYDFQMEDGDELIASLAADSYFEWSVCTYRDYQKWAKSGELMEFAGDENVQQTEISFVAPKDGKYVLLLINRARRAIEIAVNIAMWEADPDLDES